MITFVFDSNYLEMNLRQHCLILSQMRQNRLRRTMASY